MEQRTYTGQEEFLPTGRKEKILNIKGTGKRNRKARKNKGNKEKEREEENKRGEEERGKVSNKKKKKHIRNPHEDTENILCVLPNTV